MKRTNPTTNEPFKRGSVRDDGFVFFAYTKIIKSDGFFKEIWLNPQTSEKVKARDRAIKKAKYQKKTDRHSPGFSNLSASQKLTVHYLQKLSEEADQFGDMTMEMIAEELVGYELDAGPELEEAIQHAGPLAFDAREAFRLSLSL